MDFYIARQPIFKKNMQLYAYELLFREGMINLFPDTDGDTATSQLLSDTFLTSGLNKYTGGKKAFINFTKNLLVKQIPLLFPKEITVVEILENVEAETRTVNACREIAQKGYVIALDDFVYRSDLEPFISFAHIIKFDFLESSPEAIEKDLKLLRGKNIKLLAEKIETHEAFNRALAMGFDYFQGYFFSKPEIIKGKKLTTNKVNLLQVMAEVNQRMLNFDQLEKFISRDVTISFKLLCYINSVFYRRLRKIDSIGQAITLLGEAGIRRFISLIAMSNLADGKPPELIKLSAIRARFLELIEKRLEKNNENSSLFTLGLFSLIDAIMDNSMQNIMKQLPLSNSIKDALVGGTGNLVNYLKLAQSYEKGDWKNVTFFSELLNIKEDHLPMYYFEALEWGQALTSL